MSTSRSNTSPLALSPSPELAPQAVIEVVLQALQAYDAPHAAAGAEVLYAFCSPRMKGAVGDLEALKRALANELYRPLVGHSSAELGALQQIGDSARQMVTVDGVSYTVALAKARYGEHVGCWLISGIAREGV